MNIKRNIIFCLERRKKDGALVTIDVPIRMRVMYNCQRIEFTTGYRVDASKWDKNKQRVKNGTTNKLRQTATQINTDLLKYYTDIQDIFKGFEVQDIVPTSKQIKDAFSRKYKNGDEYKGSFLYLFDEFIREGSAKNNWTTGTTRRVIHTEKNIFKFDKDITFKALNEGKLIDFSSFLIDKGLKNSTIQKDLAILKQFLRWATKKGHNNNKAFETFDPKLPSIRKKVIFLTWDELTRLREYDIPEAKSYLEQSRDIFVFCCFTGLRHSDVYNLKKSDIKGDSIEITTIKTADSLTIDLNDYSRAILDKYKDVHFPENKALPAKPNVTMNFHIKELAELAGIDEPVREAYYTGPNRIDRVMPKYALLSTHAGRRTFICHALTLGIPPQVVMKWTGHSDYKAMKPYIDIADTDRKEAMKLLNRK